MSTSANSSAQAQATRAGRGNSEDIAEHHARTVEHRSALGYRTRCGNSERSRDPCRRKAPTCKSVYNVQRRSCASKGPSHSADIGQTFDGQFIKAI